MSAGYDANGRYIEQDDPPESTIKTRTVWVWWRKDAAGDWVPLRIVDDIKEWNGRTFSDIDKFTKHEIEEPSND